MNIKELAEKAGFGDAIDECWKEEIEKFAELVAAHERDACAKQLDALGCDHCAAAIRARSKT